MIIVSTFIISLIHIFLGLNYLFYIISINYIKGKD